MKNQYQYWQWDDLKNNELERYGKYVGLDELRMFGFNPKLSDHYNRPEAHHIHDSQCIHNVDHFLIEALRIVANHSQNLHIVPQQRYDLGKIHKPFLKRKKQQ